MKFTIVIILLIYNSVSSLEVTGTYRTTTWSYVSEHYQCYPITNIEILEPKQFIETVAGKHLAGYLNSDVKTYAIVSQTVHFMPLGMTKIFPNLEAFQISGCALEQIDRLDLIEYKNIHSIYFNRNKLTILEARLFDFTPKLWHIDFSYNRIRHIDPAIFDGIENLKHGDFMYNTCTGEFGPQIGEDNVKYTMQKFLLQHCQNKPDDKSDCGCFRPQICSSERINHISEFDLKKKLGIRD
ncbi:unnamed protein product [Chironomus riparius]|uniref:Uncharacterized protein n=1 Tax=Chironomus riparius TaxID=315576 RepID=A0A9N9WRP1_9DIPT|nr:unnamed protein product [Chironomus riparius]